MIDLRILTRPLLAAPFIVGGLNALKSSKAVAETAADVALPIADAVGLPKDPEMLVRLNAGVQIAGGVLLALGIMPRVTSLVLGASLVPTTLAGHRFWEQKDDKERNGQRMQFVKNAGMLGGLLATALDTGGRPSVFWTGSRAIGHAAHSVADAAGSATRMLPGVS
jgi:uncharacterized membrane protein YphA (DoxX/SURF4 family)